MGLFGRRGPTSDSAADVESDPPAQELLDADEAYQLGYLLLQQGRRDEGLRLVQDAAREGRPWALATFTWNLLKSGEYLRAISLAEEVLEDCRAFVDDTISDEAAEQAEYQLVNALSNVALCQLALGSSVEDALEVWSEGEDVGHPESRFYPAVVAERQGDSRLADAIVDELTSEERIQLAADMQEGIAESVGWFASWCSTGADVLRRHGSIDGASLAEVTDDRPQPQPSTGEARFCIHCGQARESAARFCISCGQPFPEAQVVVPHDVVALVFSEDSAVREAATQEIIQGVDIDAMTRCGKLALERADGELAEFWFMEIATAEADEATRAVGIEDLCRLVYLPAGRLEEAELYCRHAATHTDPLIRARALRTLADIEVQRAEIGQDRLEYSEDWRRVDLSQPVRAGMSTEDHYLRLLALLFARDQEGANQTLLDGLDDDYMQYMAGYLIGFGNSARESGMNRDTAARAIADWLDHRR